MKERRPPRFPYVAAALCVACLGAAVWTWMRYSYCWRMTPDEAIERASRLDERLWPTDAYIELDCLDLPVSNGTVHTADPTWRIALSGFQENPCLGSYRGRWSKDIVVLATSTIDIDDPTRPPSCRFLVFVAATRFHGGSIAGLVVSAMGVFVFTVALRHWLKERRAHAARADDAPPESELRPE